MGGSSVLLGLSAARLGWGCSRQQASQSAPFLRPALLALAAGLAKALGYRIKLGVSMPLVQEPNLTFALGWRLGMVVAAITLAFAVVG